MIGLITPFALLILLPGCAALFFAYRQKGQLPKRVISSLIIFKQLTIKPQVRRQIKLPWRFYYELGLLILLSFALAGVYWQKDQQAYHLIFDNSLSLSAVSSDHPTKTIFNQHLEMLWEDLFAGNVQEVKACLLLPSYHCANEIYTKPGEIKSFLETAKIYSKDDNLEIILNGLDLNPDVQTIIYSDYLTDSLQNKNLRLATARTGGLSNLAITNLTMLPTSEIKIEVQSFAQTPIEHVLRLYIIKQGQDRLEIEQIKEKNFSIAPNSKTDLFFTPPTEHSALIAEIKPEDLTPAIDALPMDNVYYYAKSKKNTENILLVSEENLTSKEVDSLFSGNIEQITPKNFENLTNPSEDYNLIIFNNYLPIQKIHTNQLIIGSNAEPGLFSVQIDQTPKITFWDSSSQILRYLDPKLFRFKRAWSAQLPTTFKKIVESNGQAILATAEEQGKRSIFVGFPLFPFEPLHQRALSILTLNLLKWLKSNPQQDVVQSNSENFYNYQLAGGKLIKNELPEFTKSHSGILTSIDHQQILANNFYSPDESNLSRVRKISLPDQKQFSSKVSKEQKKTNLTIILLVLSALLLGSHLIWRNKIKTKND